MSSSKDITVTYDGIVVDWIEDDPLTFRRGETQTLTLWLRGIDSGAYGESYSDTDYGGSVGSYEFRFDTLADYLEYDTENTLYYGTTDEGEPWFREDVPDFHPVDTYLVEVSHGADIETERNAWVLITGGENVTPSSVGGVRSVELDLFVLAERDEYEERAAVREAFEEPAF